MIKISIIIPVYNVAQYIERCLDSVCSQTYQGPIECILIDDCGTDLSVKIAQDYISGHKGHIDFTFVHHKQNRGLSAARNTGILNSSGDYILFLDSDDALSSTCIELMCKEIEIHPDTEIIMGRMISLPTPNEYYNLDRFKSITFSNDEKWIKEAFLDEKKCLPCNAPNKLLKRDFLIKNHLFFTEGILHEDQLWTFHVIKHLKSLAIVHSDTYLRYVTPGSIMTSDNYYSQRKNASWAIILNDILSNVEANEILLVIKRYMKEFFPRYRNGGSIYLKIGFKIAALLIKASRFRSSMWLIGFMVFEKIGKGGHFKEQFHRYLN